MFGYKTTRKPPSEIKTGALSAKSDIQPAENPSLEKKTFKDDSTAKKNQQFNKQFNKNIVRIPSGQISSAPKLLLENRLLLSTSWKIWPNTQVIGIDHKSDSDAVLTQISNLLVIESQSENADLTEFNLASPVVVYNSRLKKAGVITGALRIQTTQKGLLEQDLNNFNARITDSFENINTYFITSTDQIFNLELLYLNLKAKPYVKFIELDVISRSYEKF